MLDRLFSRDRVGRDADGSIYYQFAAGTMGARGTIGRLPRAELREGEFLAFDVNRSEDDGAWILSSRVASLRPSAEKQGEATATPEPTTTPQSQRQLTSLPTTSTARRPQSAQAAEGSASWGTAAKRREPRVIDTFNVERVARRAKAHLERVMLAGDVSRDRRHMLMAVAMILAGVSVISVLSALLQGQPSAKAAAQTLPVAAGPAADSAMPGIGRDQGIWFGPGKRDPKRTVFVFSDPNCPACRAFEVEIAQLTKEGVDVAVFPVAFQPGSDALVRNIACAVDPAQAWPTALRGETVASADCDKGRHVVALNNALFNGARMAKTPTIVLPDDTRLEGAVPAKDILVKLSKP
jgi:hypothetical protein